MGGDSHWVNWHASYEDPASLFSRRLAFVQRRLGDALDQAEDGRITLISLCAGQGRDVIGVLRGHRRRDDVIARLVELDPDLVAHSRAAVQSAGLLNVTIVQGDASMTSAYEGVVPAAVVMVCGVFGNLSDHEVHATVVEHPHLCAAGATVIWTRHRRSPDLTPAIRSWFMQAGFEEVAFDTAEDAAFGVGTHRLVGPARPFRSGRLMFSFVGDGVDARF